MKTHEPFTTILVVIFAAICIAATISFIAYVLTSDLPWWLKYLILK